MLDSVLHQQYASGIQVAWSTEDGVLAAINSIRQNIDIDSTEHVLLFASPEHSPEALCQHFQALFPETAMSGCSTAGEITPFGCFEGGLVAIALPKNGFSVKSVLIQNVSKLEIQKSNELVSELKEAMRQNFPNEVKSQCFAMCLIDGLCHQEETLVSSVYEALGDIQLVGGSAGDQLNFKRTVIFYQGQVHYDAAVVHLIYTELKFHTFKIDHFEPTDKRMVVTRSDTESRVVHELNAEPAAKEYALMTGMDNRPLSPMIFASHPVVVRIGGEYFCRSIQQVNEDNSLSFFCAIDDGIVLTAAQPKDMVDDLEQALKNIEAELGEIDFLFAFECVLRKLDAENCGETDAIEAVYQRFNVAGFHAYGEQYNFMHLNQTFTGIAFSAQKANTN